MFPTLDLTIAIPVKNEEINLKGCLDSIGKDFAKNIIVIDSGSSDRTLQIAKSFGADIVNFKWNGKFPKKRNWFLRNYTPKTKWILFLDADEYLTEEFKIEIRKKLPGTTYTGYWLHYSIYFLGKKLKGGYPLTKLALFQVGAGEYEKIDEEQWSTLDMEIHEHPLLGGKVGEINSKIDHLDFHGVSHYVSKHNEYSSWEAARFLQRSGDTDLNASLTKKQQLKYLLMKTPLIGPAYFLGSFFLLGGFKDGSRGFAFAILKMSYFMQVYCKIREARRSKQILST